jgi:hypothetical protein
MPAKGWKEKSELHPVSLDSDLSNPKPAWWNAA